MRNKIAIDYSHIDDSFKEFDFFILNNENKNHCPHVHICVENIDSKIKGAKLKFPFKEDHPFYNKVCVATLRLRPDLIYTIDNMEFEEVFNKKYISKKYKLLYLRWLYEKNFIYNMINVIACIHVYMLENKSFKNKRAYNSYLSLKRIEKTKEDINNHIENNLKMPRIATDYSRLTDTFEGLDFFIFSDEDKNHYPHVHICVENIDSKIKGAKLKFPFEKEDCFYNRICVATLKLKPNFIYTIDNMEFEEVFNKKYISKKYKYLYIRWLYSKNFSWRDFNAKAALKVYMLENKNFKDKRKYKYYINKKRIENTDMNIVKHMFIIRSKD